MKYILILTFIVFSNFGYSQIKADSVFLYYGMTQNAPEAPLMEYIENLETSGAKLQKLKVDEWTKVNDCFKSVKSKKYKEGKHEGTVYFVTFFEGGNKKFGAFDTTTEKGRFINLSDKKEFSISDPASSDRLYYALLKIH